MIQRCMIIMDDGKPFFGYAEFKNPTHLDVRTLKLPSEDGGSFTPHQVVAVKSIVEGSEWIVIPYSKVNRVVKWSGKYLKNKQRKATNAQTA